MVGLIAVPSNTPTHGHFVLSPVPLALRDPHLHLRSHGKIGDCEQSKYKILTAVFGHILANFLAFCGVNGLDCSCTCLVEFEELLKTTLKKGQRR